MNRIFRKLFSACRPFSDAIFVIVLAVILTASGMLRSAHAQTVATKASVATAATVTGIGAVTSYSGITGATTARQGAVSGADAASVLAGARTDYQAQAYSTGSGQSAGMFSANLTTHGVSAAAAALQGQACAENVPLTANAQTTATLALAGVTGQGGAAALLGDSLSHGTLERGTAVQAGIPVTTMTATTIANQATASTASSLVTLDGTVLQAPRSLVAAVTGSATQTLGPRTLINSDE